MSLIKPIKSMREQAAESQAQRHKSQRKLDMAERLMREVVSQFDPVRLQRVIDLYASVIEESPELPQPYLALAYLSWKLDDEASAERWLQEVLLIHPTLMRAHELQIEIQQDRKQRIKQRHLI